MKHAPKSSSRSLRRGCAPLAVALATLLTTGCGRGFVITTPAGFAELEDQEEYGYRAANAEGVVLAVRREPNRPQGDLAFWAGAVDAHLRRAGYVAVKALDVETEDGTPGRQIRYERVQQGRDHRFWVSIFVADAVVVTVEAGGDREYFDRQEKALGAALQSLRLD